MNKEMTTKEKDKLREEINLANAYHIAINFSKLNRKEQTRIRLTHARCYFDNSRNFIEFYDMCKNFFALRHLGEDGLFDIYKTFQVGRKEYE